MNSQPQADMRSTQSITYKKEGFNLSGLYERYHYRVNEASQDQI